MKNSKVMSKRRRDRRREVRAAMQDEIALSARKKIEGDYNLFQIYLGRFRKSN
jgi:hypothetical protein